MSELDDQERTLWEVAPGDAHKEQVLQSELRIGRLLARLLVNRGIDAPDAADAFLKPTPQALHRPGSLAGIERATARIIEAIEAGQRITLYGDYDVDGVTGSAILHHFFELLGKPARVTIPERKDGYGLSRAAIDRELEAGCQLLVTIDCGVRAIDPIAYAMERGIDCIVTDHHEPGGQLPPAVAVVNPKQAGCPYPYKNLCGAALAFKLAWEVARRLTGEHADKVEPRFRAFLKHAMGLAAIGTVADIVPLTGENRVLAAAGLRCLTATPYAGLQALIRATRLAGKPIASEHIGFRLGPRINAAGRMGSAKRAFELLTTDDPVRAAEIADELEQANRDRRAVERAIFEQAWKAIEAEPGDPAERMVMVVSGEDWHPGVVGIVASRLVERYHRPAVVISHKDGTARGSCRSIKGFHLLDALLACEEHLVRAGGHAMAAGLEIDPANIPAFKAALEEEVAATMDPALLQRRITIDALAGFDEIDGRLLDELSWLEPTGAANRAALLATRGVELAAPPQQLGEGKHFAAYGRHNGRTLRLVAFNQGELASQLQVGDRIDIAYQAKVNNYNGNYSIELHLRDVQPSTESPLRLEPQAAPAAR